ncbi:hypothetical protein QFZ87_003080 [Bacillus sp. SLBN-46]|nr:hypothetical protein [Bacillus sp. SLBN-46]
MLDLTYYQSVFTEVNTEIRCGKVLEEISIAIMSIY